MLMALLSERKVARIIAKHARSYLSEVKLEKKSLKSQRKMGVPIGDGLQAYQAFVLLQKIMQHQSDCRTPNTFQHLSH